MKQRESHIELLRIILMFMIVCGHILNHGVFNNHVALSSYDYLIQNFSVIFYPGVTGFILISGYYGIRPSVKGGLKFWFICFFWLIVSVLVKTSVGGGISFRTFVYDVCLCLFSWGHGLWFIVSYFFLYSLSPFINAYHKALSEKELQRYMILLIVFDVLVGYVFRMSIYEYWHFIVLYSIGYCLSRHKDFFSRRVQKWQCICIFVVSTILLWLERIYPLPFISQEYTNSNPLIIIAGSALFLYFLKVKMAYSPIINRIAKSVFAIYVFHENIWIRPYISSNVSDIKETVSSPFGYVGILLFIIALFIIIPVFDSLRILLTDKLLFRNK